MPTTGTRGPPAPSSRVSIVLRRRVLLLRGLLLLVGLDLFVALAQRVADPVQVRVWAFGHTNALPGDGGGESGRALAQLLRRGGGERHPQGLRPGVSRVE